MGLSFEAGQGKAPHWHFAQTWCWCWKFFIKLHKNNNEKQNVPSCCFFLLQTNCEENSSKMHKIWVDELAEEWRSCGGDRGDGAINSKLLPTARRRRPPMTYGQDMQNVGEWRSKLLANARLPIEAKRRQDWRKFVNNSEINFKWAPDKRWTRITHSAQTKE